MCLKHKKLKYAQAIYPTHFRVLALSAVPLRFISRSLRLKKAEQQCWDLQCLCDLWSHLTVRNCICAPVVHVPEKLQVELVDGVVNLLSVALHQLCIVHQLLLQGNTKQMSRCYLCHNRWVQNLCAFIFWFETILFYYFISCYCYFELTWLKRCDSTVSGRALVRPDNWYTGDINCYQRKRKADLVVFCKQLLDRYLCSSPVNPAFAIGIDVEQNQTFHQVREDQLKANTVELTHTRLLWYWKKKKKKEQKPVRWLTANLART